MVMNELELENKKLRVLLTALGEWSDHCAGWRDVKAPITPFKDWCRLVGIGIDWDLYISVVRGTKIYD
jgi:hypothetical protein